MTGYAVLDTLYDALHELGRCPDLASLRQQLDSTIGGMGVPMYAYHIVRAPGSADPEPWYITSYPQDWVRQYRDRGLMEHDPVLRQAASTVAPFQWSRTLSPASASEEAVMEGGRSYGLHEGLTVPLNAQNEFAAMTLAFDQNPQEVGPWLAAYESHIALLALYTHDAARQHFRRADGGDWRLLTDRERECVRWTAAGKTSWEIGRILSISEKTVNLHIYSAMAKLDVRTRAQLVARALWLGLLKDL